MAKQDCRFRGIKTINDKLMKQQIYMLFEQRGDST